MALKQHTKAIIAAFGVYFIWGFTLLASTVAQRTASPMVYLMYRFDIAAFLMLIPAMLGKAGLNLRGKKLLPLIMLGICEPVIYFIGEQYGLKYSNSSFTGIFISIIPLLNVVLASIIFRERPTAAQWFFCVLSICGVIAISVFSSQAGGKITVRGIIWLCIAVLSAGGYTMLSKIAASDNIGIYERTVVTLSEGAVFFTVSAMIEHRADLSALIIPASVPSFLLSALYVAVFASVVGYTLFNYAIDNAPVANVVTLNSIVTVISVTVGVVFLSEPFNIKSGLSMLVVIIGVWGVQKFTPENVKKQNST